MFKIAFRYLWRKKLFTALNILGLAIGISVCSVIYSIVAYEFSFDKKQPDSERIYQVVSQYQDLETGDIRSFGGAPRALLSHFINESTGVELVVPIYYRYTHSVTVKSNRNEEITFETPENVVKTLSSYFELIPYKWLAGDPNTALNEPGKVVLTLSRAQKYFPNQSVESILGKTIMYDDTILTQVSGVINDLDYLNSFVGQEFFSLEAESLSEGTWGGGSSDDILFVKLKKVESIYSVLEQLNKKHTEQQSHSKKFKSWNEFLPLAEKHFAIDFPDYHAPLVNKEVLYGLISVAGFLLLLACINYINLSTAQIPQRAKEIGIRKTLGSTPSSLIGHFLIETFLITLLAILLSFLFYHLIFTLFSDFFPSGMFDSINYRGAAVFGLMLTTLVVILAGIYPAWLITRVQAVHILKGQSGEKVSRGTFTFRKGLIVFQFVIAQVFVIVTIIIGAQLEYILNKDLGFNEEGIISIDIPYRLRSNESFENKHFLLKDELNKYSDIRAVALGDLPMKNGYHSYFLTNQSDSVKITLDVNSKSIDVDYLNLFDIELLAGRKFVKSDTVREYIINESTAKALGFSTPEEAIGKILNQYGRDSLNFPIVGVVKDFHHSSFKREIGPLVFISQKSRLGTLNIKLHPADMGRWENIIRQIEEEWKKLYPTPFEYKFYDEVIAGLYQKENNTAKLINAATGVTIFIGCLGLFGLVTLAAFQRTKEIGIRKVMGSSVIGIVRLLSIDFVKLVFVAILIASPIAWWTMNKWLEDFVYRIDIEWWMFALSGIVGIAIAFLTVSFQAVKAAMANPVDSLRDE